MSSGRLCLLHYSLCYFFKIKVHIWSLMIDVLVFCKSLSQMLSNFYRDFILIFEILIKFTLWLYLLKSISDQPFTGDLMGGVLRAPADLPIGECDFNEVVRQLHWKHTSAWVFSCGFAAHFSGRLFMRAPLRNYFEIY